MKRTIFYSWQSQLPNATNRTFIRDALEKAAKEVGKDATIDVRPDVDQDTANVPGSPNIANTIRDKIDAAEIVVCDVSIVQRPGWLGRWLHGERMRPVPNANVLVELGYAMKSLGTTDRLVLVMNTAYGAIEELPFDLRQYRPTTYRLHAGASDKPEVRKELVSTLAKTFRQVLAGPSRRDLSSDAWRRCGNVYWLGHNIVTTALSAAVGQPPDFSGPIHNAQQVPLDAIHVAEIRALEHRSRVGPVDGTFINAVLEVARNIGRVVQSHQPDFPEHDSFPGSRRADG